MDPLKPIEALKKASAILHQEGPLQTGRGDYLPEGFLKLQLFPFTWKG